MLDHFGRIHTNLRISVTDVCNFRCIYCMPEDMTFMPDAALMTFDEILHLTRIFVALGVSKVRITGGEPLVRPGVPALIKQLTQLENTQRYQFDDKRYWAYQPSTSTLRCWAPPYQCQFRYAQ